MSSTNNTKQVAWVAIGSSFSFAFAILSSMILSRHFNKEDYGTYQQVLYIYHTLLSVFTLGLPKAYSYFLPRVRNNEAKDVINKINHLFFILGGAFSLALYVNSPFIAQFMKNDELARALRIFSPVPFLMLPTMGLEGVLATYKKSHSLAVYTFVTRLALLVCVTFPVVFMHGTYTHAIVGFTISSCISFGMALFLKYYPVRGYDHEKSSLTYLEIFRFSLPLLVASIWGILINSTDQFFISRYFGKKTYAEFANGGLEFPIASLLISACSTVMTPLFARQVKEGGDFSKSILPVWQATISKSVMILYPLLILCIFEAPSIMEILYGRNYINSSGFFRIKQVVNFVKIMPYAPMIIALGSVRFYSMSMMLAFIGLAASEYVSILLFDNPYCLVLIHTLCIILLSFALILHIAIKINIKIKSLIPSRIIFKVAMASLFALGAILAVDKVLALRNLYWKVMADGCVYFAVYGIFCVFSKIDYMALLRPLTSK